MAQQIITHELVTEVGDFVSVVEASTLGLRAGDWPERLSVHPKVGNGQPLVRDNAEFNDGELQAVNYRQQWGVLRVRVFND
jgi:hypothetical protein